MTIPAIELQSISKRFGQVEVLSEVGLSLMPGRVHALAGENGAGKSTLVKIIGGVHQPDSGRILLNGEPVRFADPAESRAHGIAVVHQHPALFPDLTVAENVFIGRQPRRGGRIDWREMMHQSRLLLDRIGVDFQVTQQVKELGVSERQAIEVARALAMNARVLVLDEPTSALSGNEVRRLFELVARLRADGVAVLFITHFIDEIMSFSDDVTVLRSGRHIVTDETRNFTPESIVRSMIGAKLETFFPKQEVELGKPVLTVRGLSGLGRVKNVDFDIRAGEIMGFFGLVGAGRSEIASMLFGVEQPDAGTIMIDDREIAPRSPRDAIQHGISLVPEDRHRQGLVLQFPIRANETLPLLKTLSNAFGRINFGRERELATDYSKRLRVVSSGIEQATGRFRGKPAKGAPRQMADAVAARPHSG